MLLISLKTLRLYFFKKKTLNLRLCLQMFTQHKFNTTSTTATNISCNNNNQQQRHNTWMLVQFLFDSRLSI